MNLSVIESIKGIWFNITITMIIIMIIFRSQMIAFELDYLTKGYISSDRISIIYYMLCVVSSPYSFSDNTTILDAVD